jgi:hypothetical protein
MRSYLNIEDEHVRALLQMFVEISLSRDLTKSERYIQTILKETLHKSVTEW